MVPALGFNIPKIFKGTSKNKNQGESLLYIVAETYHPRKMGTEARCCPPKSRTLVCPSLIAPTSFQAMCPSFSPKRYKDSPFPSSLSTKPFKPCQPVPCVGFPSSYPWQSTNWSSHQRRQQRTLEGSEGTIEHLSTSCSVWVAYTPPNRREHNH